MAEAAPNVPLSRANLSAQIAERLGRRVTTRMKPGDMLAGEKMLAEEFGVSRPIVRESLRMLEGAGLIRVEKGRGAFVEELSSAPLLRFFERAVWHGDTVGLGEVMQLRRIVEVQTARLAAHQRSEADVETLGALAAGMALAIDDPALWTKLDTEFHIALGASSGSALIVHVSSSLRDAVATAVRTGFDRQSGSEVAAVAENHRRIAEAIERRDADAAEVEMAAHFDRAESVLGLALAERGM